MYDWGLLPLRATVNPNLLTKSPGGLSWECKDWWDKVGSGTKVCLIEQALFRSSGCISLPEMHDGDGY